MVFLFCRGYYTLSWHTTFEFGKIANSNGWYVGFHCPSYRFCVAAIGVCVVRSVNLG